MISIASSPRKRMPRSSKCWQLACRSRTSRKHNRVRNLTSHTTDKAGSRSSLLTQLSGFVETRLGLHFPPERLGDLERGIGSAAAEFGFNTIASCIEWLLSSNLSRRQIET